MDLALSSQDPWILPWAHKDSWILPWHKSCLELMMKDLRILPWAHKDPQILPWAHKDTDLAWSSRSKTRQDLCFCELQARSVGLWELQARSVGLDHELQPRSVFLSSRQNLCLCELKARFVGLCELKARLHPGTTHFWDCNARCLFSCTTRDTN